MASPFADRKFPNQNLCMQSLGDPCYIHHVGLGSSDDKIEQDEQVSCRWPSIMAILGKSQAEYVIGQEDQAFVVKIEVLWVLFKLIQYYKYQVKS